MKFNSTFIRKISASAILLCLLIWPIKAMTISGWNFHVSHLPASRLMIISDPDTSESAVKVSEENSRINLQTTRIYPNPFSSTITIKLTGEWQEETTVRIYNAIGALVLDKKMTGSEYSVEVSHLPAGIYFLDIRDNINSLNRRLLKK